MATEVRTDWPLVLLLWLAGLGAAGQYAKISVIFDQLGTVYADAGTALGFIVSLVGAVGIVLGVVAGVMVARIGYARAIIVGLVAGAVLSALQASFPPLPLLLGLRVLEGAAHLLMVVAIPTMIAQVTSEADRGLALTLWSTFFSVAFTALTWLGLPLVDRFGLGSLIYGHGAYLLLFALILWRRLPMRVGAAPALSLRDVLRAHRRIYTSPNLAAPAVGWLAYTICFLSILTVIPPYLPEVGRAAILGAMPIAAILASMTVGVWGLRHFGAVSVIVSGFFLCTGLSLALLIWPGAPVLALGLGAALGLIQGATFAAVPEMNATAEDRALANGGLAQMGNLGNTIGTPLLVAIIAFSGYAGMMVVLAAIFGIGAALHMWLGRLRKGET